MWYTFCILGSVLKLAHASGADHLALKFSEHSFAAAEKAGIFILFKYNFVSVNIDFNRIGAAYIHFGAHLLGNNNASKLVNASYNTGGFHFC